MNDTLVESYEHDGKRLEIHRDTHPQDPREWQRSTSTMAAFHKRYNLGDDVPFNADDFSGWGEMRAHIEEEYDVVAIRPLYLIDHSGIAMSTSSFQNPWDSGQVGFIWMTEEHLDNTGYETEEEARDLLKRLVESYSRFLEGRVYSYRLYELDTCDKGHEHKEMIDSCGGFMGETLNEVGDQMADYLGEEWGEVIA